MTYKLTKNGLRIFQDDFSEKAKNIHDEMEKHHSYKKKKRVENMDHNNCRPKFWCGQCLNEGQGWKKKQEMPLSKNQELS